MLAACAQTPSGSSSAKEVRAAASENPRARIHTELGAQYYARGQYAIALQELHEALESDRDYALAYNVLGLVHVDLGEYALAESHFKRALDLQRNFSEAYSNYGWFLCQRGRYEEAHSQFEAALANPLYATPSKASLNAAACSVRQGDTARAETYYQRTLKLTPNQPDALLGLAELRFRQGSTVSARQLLKQLAQQGELNAQGLWLGVRIERALVDGEAAARHASQLRARFPDSQEAVWLRLEQYDQPGGRP